MGSRGSAKSTNASNPNMGKDGNQGTSTANSNSLGNIPACPDPASALLGKKPSSSHGSIATAISSNASNPNPKKGNDGSANSNSLGKISTDLGLISELMESKSSTSSRNNNHADASRGSGGSANLATNPTKGNLGAAKSNSLTKISTGHGVASALTAASSTSSRRNPKDDGAANSNSLPKFSTDDHGVALAISSSSTCGRNVDNRNKLEGRDASVVINRQPNLSNGNIPAGNPANTVKQPTASGEGSSRPYSKVNGKQPHPHPAGGKPAGQ